MTEVVVTAIMVAAGTLSHTNMRSNAIATGFNLIATGVRNTETTFEPSVTAMLSAVPLVAGPVCGPDGVTLLRHDPKCLLFV